MVDCCHLLVTYCYKIKLPNTHTMEIHTVTHGIQTLENSGVGQEHHLHFPQTSQCAAACLDIYLSSSLKYLLLLLLKSAPIGMHVMVTKLWNTLRLKLTNILAKEKKVLQGNKFIRNNNVQFVQLVVDYPDETLVKIKLSSCIFPP